MTYSRIQAPWSRPVWWQLASLPLLWMITLSGTAPLRWQFAGNHAQIQWKLAEPQLHKLVVRRDCRARVYAICSVVLILFLIKALKSVSAECQGQEMISSNISLQQMMLFHILIGAWHVNTAVIFLSLLFTLRSSMLWNTVNSLHNKFRFLLFFFPSQFLKFFFPEFF